MPNESVDSLTLGGSAASDLTVWGLFLEADIVVKIVMIILLFCSFWTWAIIFEKISRLRRLRSRAEDFEESFWSGGSLDDLYDRLDSRPTDPMSALFVSAMREWRRSIAKGLAASEQARNGLQQRVERVMGITLGREMDRLERHMTFLASVGSAAPFVGLFGTVWGIMNAFTSIAASKNTSLAVVAPGIAEALFATALGLVAAIPAVIAFNKLSNDLGRYAARLEAFQVEFGAILSRQMEEAR
ncbi:MAG: protein TolQ [Kiloniellales bacterium]|nr:protein TolQ [Kiloniellales bacterium]